MGYLFPFIVQLDRDKIIAGFCSPEEHVHGTPLSFSYLCLDFFVLYVILKSLIPAFP